MKVTELPSRILKWLGLASVALATVSSAQAQLTPNWTVNHGQAVPAATARNEYFNNLSFLGTPLVRDTLTIDVNWGFQSPDPSIPVDGFTSRHTGRIVPTSTDSYHFIAKVSGGVKMWLDGQLILDFWIEHPENSEFVSAACQLKGGSVYNLKVEYFETAGVASTHLFWQASSMPRQLVRFQNSPDGTGAQFGSVMSGSGSGRLVVGAPETDALIHSVSNIYVREGGRAWVYDQSGQSLGELAGPTNHFRFRFGGALAAFPDGRVLVGSANHAMNGNVTNLYNGSVVMYSPTGERLGEWLNPEGVTNSYSYFGHKL